MSRTALVGGLGLGHQGAKGSAVTDPSSITWLPASSIGVNPQQQVQQIPLEISGDFFQRGSYKTSVAVSGDVALMPRPDSFGHILYMLCGQDTVTPVPSQSGAFSHVMSPFAPSTTADLPWYTMLKDVSKMWSEQYSDMRMSALRMSIAKQGIAQATASFFGLTPLDQAAISTSQSFDSGPVWQTCQATVSLKHEATGLDISANSAFAERIQLSFDSRLSQDEYAVGRYTPVDVTLLSRAASVSYDLVIRDEALRQAVYQNGGTSNWDPTVYRGALHLVMASSALIPGTTQPYQLNIDIPGVDFLMLPIEMSGGELLRANLSAVVTLGPSGADKFTFTLVNGTAAY